MQNEKDDKQDQKTEHEILMGREILAEFEDGRTSEKVTVKRVSLRFMGRYAACIGSDEATEIAMYTGKPVAWADELKDDSVQAIVDAGREMSAKRYANFGLRVTKFDATLRQANPALGQLLAERASQAAAVSR